MRRSRPAARRQATEVRLVVGGYAIVVLLGGALVWLLYGSTAAGVALAVMLAAGLLFAALYLLLSGIDLMSR